MLIKLEFILSLLSNQRDYISSLPQEIILCILSYLAPEDLLSIYRVNKLFHKLADDKSIWENIWGKNNIKYFEDNALNFRAEYIKFLKTNKAFMDEYYLQNVNIRPRLLPPIPIIKIPLFIRVKQGVTTYLDSFKMPQIFKYEKPPVERQNESM